MVFSSVIFLFCFLPVVLSIYFVIPARFWNVFLLLASLFFYAWGETFFVLVMLVSVTANYLFGRALESTWASGYRRHVLVLAVCLNLGLLFFYKYANFVVDNVNLLLDGLQLPLIPLGTVHLPIGISFFTFQALSYVIDVYRRRVAAEKRFVNVAFYIALFPQLIAGPIIRYRDVAAQIVKRHIDLPGFAYGVQRFLIGFGKKVLIANTVGEAVDRIYAIPDGQVPVEVAWLGAFYFMLQLYFDFSGYSDMAIGLGRMFGLRFQENFNYPYISKSVIEFWQRWHISLSTWFRDYLFTPLGGYRVSRPHAYMNLTIVALLCGLWHGASWNFVVFGLNQGVLLVMERVFAIRKRPLFQTPIGNLYLLLVVACNMVLFRSADIGQVGSMMKAMAGMVPQPNPAYHAGLYVNNELLLASVVAVIGACPVLPWLRRGLGGWEERWRHRPLPLAGLALGSRAVVMAALAGIFLLCAGKLAAETHNPFIYFRF